MKVEVWSRPGVSSPTYSDSYVRAFTGSVTGLGPGTPTLLPAFSSPIVIPPNSSHTFYTTGKTDPISIYYTNGSALQTTFASDSYIEIKEGWSVRFPFSTPRSPTRWNGKADK